MYEFPTHSLSLPFREGYGLLGLKIASKASILAKEIGSIPYRQNEIADHLLGFLFFSPPILW
jgi:hypothetical protein